MLRGIIIFLVFTILFYAGIEAFRAATGKQKLELIKVLTLSVVCAILSVTILFWIAILF